MREEITYVNVASVGELYIGEIINRIGMLEYKDAYEYKLVTRLKDACWLDNRQIKYLKKFYGNKIQIHSMKMEVM